MLVFVLKNTKDILYLIFSSKNINISIFPFNKKGCVVSLLPEIGCTADVFIRKDEEPETYIGTKTINSNYLPTDMFVKRKFKKYKRIQFIVRDDTANPFGINCIIKSYSIGNFAKK